MIIMQLFRQAILPLVPGEMPEYKLRAKGI